MYSVSILKALLWRRSSSTYIFVLLQAIKYLSSVVAFRLYGARIIPRNTIINLVILLYKEQYIHIYVLFQYTKNWLYYLAKMAVNHNAQSAIIVNNPRTCEIITSIRGAKKSIKHSTHIIITCHFISVVCLVLRAVTDL